jgi:hypothetical protein
VLKALSTNKTGCCHAATLRLHAAPNQRMYSMLTANYSRLCRVQPPGAAPEPFSEDSSVFPIPPRPAQRAAEQERRFRARAASGPRLPSCSRDGFRHGITDYPDRTRSDMRWPASALAPRRVFSDRIRRRFLPPTCSDGPTLDAPDCVADQDPRRNRNGAERKLGTSLYSDAIPFGVAPRVAFWPSPHPRIRWTVASPGGATCAHGNTRPPPS